MEETGEVATGKDERAKAMITKEQLAEIESFVDSIRTLGMKLVCMDCNDQLEGSDPNGSRVSHGLCQKCFNVRMAEIRKETV